MVSFGFLAAQLCWLETHLARVMTSQFLLAGANIVSRKALDNVAERAEVDALQKKGSKHLATGSEDSQHCLTVVVRPFLYARRAVQSTSNFSPEGSRSIGQNGLPRLGTCTKSNLLELIERDERVNIVPHVAVLNFQGNGEQGMLSQPWLDDRV